MELQPFNPRYAPLVASWMPDSLALRQVDPLADSAITADLILRWMERADYPFMLLPTPQGDPVGYGELHYPRHMPGIVAQHVMVDPRVRGQGYGWTLIERLGHVAHARFGEERLGIQVEQAHVTAIALLKAMGFAEVSPVTLMPPTGGQGVSAMLLSARLPLAPFQHREKSIPDPGEAPGYGRGLRWT